VPTVGTIYSRNFSLTNLSNPIVLPALDVSTNYMLANATMNLQSSLNGGASYTPYTGVGSIDLLLRQTNSAAGTRRFETEMLSLNMPLNGQPGYALRESPTLASRGELVAASTNGGFLL